jgi:glycosyltransferase involved in cell wall biosynthesis
VRRDDSTTRGKRIFLTWQEHRRSVGLASFLQLDLVVLKTPFRGWLQRVVLVQKTLVFLIHRRPVLVVVQNPSLVLALLVTALKPLLRHTLVVDAHNEAVDPFIHDTPLIRAAGRWIARSSDITIVTNPALAEVIRQNGGNPFVLWDPIPAVPAACSKEPVKTPGQFFVCVIATYAPDEPVVAILEAAETLPDISFVFTGDAERHLPEGWRNRRPNVRFSGFLNEADYWQLLAASDAVLDLTLMSDCLVCGAYEGLAVGKPLILSDNNASRELFYKGSYHTQNSTPAIRAALEAVKKDHEMLVKQARELSAELDARWHARAAALRDRLEIPAVSH